MENEKLGMEALEKLGVSGGAFSDLTTKEKLAIAALCVGSAAVGAGAGVLGTNKYRTGSWLGKGDKPASGSIKNYVLNPKTAKVHKFSADFAEKMKKEKPELYENASKWFFSEDEVKEHGFDIDEQTAEQVYESMLGSKE